MDQPATRITHQDIVDRWEALSHERSIAYRLEESRINAERLALQELCGGIGHVFLKVDSLRMSTHRECAFCKAQEPGPSGAGGLISAI